MEIKLKPCPFCGGEAHLCSAKANASGTKMAYKVYCAGTRHCRCMPTTGYLNSKTEAINAWNRRC